jgi:peptidoglycan/xylan/chitin deacetylase (PgdA/CDA1 family)
VAEPAHADGSPGRAPAAAGRLVCVALVLALAACRWLPGPAAAQTPQTPSPPPTAGGGPPPEPAGPPPAPPAGPTPRQAPAAVDGAIPVLEYHAVAPQDGRWARSPAGLRSDLERLYGEGFRPVDLDQIGLHPVPVPPGMHPVVLTFDDGLPSQFSWAAGSPGVPAPDCAVGILWQFHLEHPDWPFAATFFVNAHPFGSDSAGKLRWLVEHGAEIGNHTYDHADLSRLDPAGRQAEIGRLQAYLAQVLPGYAVHSFAFPYGSVPDVATVSRGTYAGVSWDFRYLALVGSGPLLRQPEGTPAEIPRIQVAAPETVPPGTLRFVWWGWEHDWLPTAHLYTVQAPGDV